MKTVGDHIRAKRIEKGLLQYEVADLIGVCEASITNWENNLSEPKIMHLPSIIKFLGHYTYPVDVNSFGARIKKYRYTNGLSHKKMGALIGVDGSTIGSWENDEHLPQKKFQKG